MPVRNYYKIKTWSEEKNNWDQTFYYPFGQPRLLRTCGWMSQDSINYLPTKGDILKVIHIAKI